MTILASASSGAVTATYEYDPFGSVLRATGPMALLNPYRFSTKYTDGESGFNYYGYRYYQADKGRWLSRDPIGERVERNLYRSVHNNPIARIDLLGLAPADDGGWGGFPKPSLGNCWRYACSDPAKPGEKPRIDPSAPQRTGKVCRYLCEDLFKAARQKGAIDPGADGKCPEGFYRIKGVVMEKRSVTVGDETLYDYHWYKEDDDGTWSGKPGDLPVKTGIKDPVEVPQPMAWGRRFTGLLSHPKWSI